MGGHLVISPDDIFPESRIVLLCPHYDDIPLTLGGTLSTLAEAGILGRKEIHIIQIFSRSNYQARDDSGNVDYSIPRIQHATGIRLIEDIETLDLIIGPGHYRYEVLRERECVMRKKPWKAGEKFEFPTGSAATFDKDELAILHRLERAFDPLVRSHDTTIVAPLGIKEHVDHILVREALLNAAKTAGGDLNAAIDLAEEQPYTGLASETDWALARKTLEAYNAVARDCPINTDLKVERIMRGYPSQVEASYEDGIRTRAAQLEGAERLWRLQAAKLL
jgi:LmbE family N-acetylglucosaminyl deacetylase